MINSLENLLSIKNNTHTYYYNFGDSFTSPDLLKSFDIEKKTIESVGDIYPIKITNYYLRLIKNKDDAIGRQCLPNENEINSEPFSDKDPLCEEAYSPTPRVIHRYPGRVLIIATNNCAMYCRFCTRKRNIKSQTTSINNEELQAALDYLRAHDEIHDVLISGGDPFTLSTQRLEYILKELRKIEHIEIMRIGTKIPCVYPMRIDEDLCSMLKKYHPLYVNVHFNHPDELTSEATRACRMLADAGIALGNQSVLLKDVNDDPEIMKRLLKGLLRARVRPYYIFIPDLVKGTHHFRIKLKSALEIINSLQGFVSGMAIPRLVIDLPDGGGKVSLLSDSIISKNGTEYSFKNYEGKICKYVDV